MVIRLMNSVIHQPHVQYYKSIPSVLLRKFTAVEIRWKF